MTIPWNFTGCYSIEEWKQIIEEWGKSGLSKAAYCRVRNIPYHGFNEWQKKIYPSMSLSSEALRERWKQIIDNWEKSGLSKHAYCKSKGLNSNTFYLWEKELNPHLPRKTSHMKAVERWTLIIEDWQRSGLNKFAYCNKHGLVPSGLYKWTKNLVSPKPLELPRGLAKEPYAKVSSQPQGRSHCLNSAGLSPSTQRIEITFAHGQYFRLRGPFDWPKLMAWLTPLLKT